MLKEENIQETQETEKKSSEVSSDKMENLIQDTTKQLEEIKVSLADKATEIDELHAIALEQEKKFQDELAKRESEIKELQTALETATNVKEEAIKELNDLKEEALLNERIRKLHDLNLLRSGEESQIKQVEKIKTMSEEVFADYIEEILDLRGKTVDASVIDKSAEPAEEITSETIDKLTEEVTKVDDEQAKAKLREILTNLKKEDVETEAGQVLVEEEVKENENKEVASVATLPEVSLLQKAFLGILNLKNTDKEGK
jgi:uncharacterized protein YukE